MEDSETPTSTHKLSRLEEEADALEKAGKTDEAELLRSTVHTLRVLIDKVKSPPRP